MRALLSADRNQQYLRSRMTEAQRAAMKARDFRPFIIADADTGHGGEAHVRNLVRRFVEAGGHRTLLYGGNANLYHCSVHDFAQLLELLAEHSAPTTRVIPAIGPDFGKMMELIEDVGFDASFSASHGVITNATASEITMPIDASSSDVSNVRRHVVTSTSVATKNGVIRERAVPIDARHSRQGWAATIPMTQPKAAPPATSVR